MRAAIIAAAFLAAAAAIPPPASSGDVLRTLMSREDAREEFVSHPGGTWWHAGDEERELEAEEAGEPSRGDEMEHRRARMKARGEGGGGGGSRCGGGTVREARLMAEGGHGGGGGASTTAGGASGREVEWGTAEGFGKHRARGGGDGGLVMCSGDIDRNSGTVRIGAGSAAMDLVGPGASDATKLARKPMKAPRMPLMTARARARRPFEIGCREYVSAQASNAFRPLRSRIRSTVRTTKSAVDATQYV